MRRLRRRVCDEEERLELIGAQEEAAAIREANDQAIQRMEIEEARYLKRLQRFSDVEQWLQLCRLVENDEEKRGVEQLLRELTVPLEVVYTVALDEVKDHVGEWRAAIHKRRSKPYLRWGRWSPSMIMRPKNYGLLEGFPSCRLRGCLP